MTFARPEVLPWLWLLAAIPLLYLVRRRARAVAVPHLHLWERVLERRGRTPLRRIRQWLSILLQMLMAAAIILAWAGPSRQAVTTRKVAVAAVFDISLSMGARLSADGEATRLDEAKSLFIEEHLDDLRNVGDLAVFAAGSRVVPVQAFTTERARVTQALERLPRPSGDFDVSALASWVREKKRGSEVHVVVYTDGATTGAEALVDLDVAIVRAGVGNENAGIIGVSSQEAGGGKLRIVTRLAAVGAETTGTIIVMGERGEKAETAATVSRDAPLDVTVELTLEEDEETWIEVRWQPDGADLLAADDVAWLRRPPRQRLSLLVVAEEVDPYLSRALAALPELVDRAAASVVEPTSWRRATEGRDVIVLCDLEEKRPLPPGRYLLLGTSAPGLPLSWERATGDIEIGDAKQGESILRGLDLRDLNIDRARPVKVQAGATALLESSVGPLVVRGRQGDELRFVHTAFEVSERNTSFVLLPAWPLFLKDALEWLAPIPRRRFPTALSAGRPFTASGEVPRPLMIRSEEGVLREAAASGGGTWIAPAKAGRWNLVFSGGEEAVGVNVADFARTDIVSKLAEPRSGDWPSRAVAEDAVDVTWWFLTALLGFLLLEWLLYHLEWTR